MRLFAIGILASASVALVFTKEATAYDMDCKVILCLAGGFPATCSDAYRYMIKRITRRPKPLPPFGFCAMSDGSEYTAHHVSYQFLHGGAAAYDCPEGKALFYQGARNDDGWRPEVAFCYSHKTRTRFDWRSDGPDQFAYHGRSFAQRVNFQLKIVIEPGTESEYRSPLFRINTNTGYLSQRPSE